MTTELKPCPLCTKIERLHRYETVVGEYVQCRGCVITALLDTWQSLPRATTPAEVWVGVLCDCDKPPVDITAHVGRHPSDRRGWHYQYVPVQGAPQGERAGSIKWVCVKCGAHNEDHYEVSSAPGVYEVAEVEYAAARSFAKRSVSDPDPNCKQCEFMQSIADEACEHNERYLRALKLMHAKWRSIRDVDSAELESSHTEVEQLRKRLKKANRLAEKNGRSAMQRTSQYERAISERQHWHSKATELKAENERLYNAAIAVIGEYGMNASIERLADVLGIETPMQRDPPVSESRDNEKVECPHLKDAHIAHLAHDKSGADQSTAGWLFRVAILAHLEGRDR